MIALYLSNKDLSYEILGLANKQWKYLKNMDNPDLDIYKTADDSDIVTEFISSIAKEKELRRQSNAYSKLIPVILARIELYKAIFSYRKRDMKKLKELIRQIIKEVENKFPGNYKEVKATRRRAIVEKLRKYFSDLVKKGS